MDALKISVAWMTKLHEKYGEEKAYKIIKGFSEVYSVLEGQEEDVRNNILALFVETGAEIKKESK